MELRNVWMEDISFLVVFGVEFNFVVNVEVYLLFVC